MVRLLNERLEQHFSGPDKRSIVAFDVTLER